MVNEKVAYWFFRLNGFLTIENFLLHHESDRRRIAGELDILGLRFHHRKELALREKPEEQMKDHEFFDSRDKTEFIIAEATTQKYCKINGPWKDERAIPNMKLILNAIGPLDDAEVEIAAQALSSEEKFYENDHLRIRICAIGYEINTDLPQNIVQLIWVKS